MFRNNVPFKAALGYGIVAVILVISIILVYSNTRSVIAISDSVREYADRQERNDSAISQILKDEQENLLQLNDALDRSHNAGVLHRKVKGLQNGYDSVVVKPKTTEEHREKKTTIEVARTRKGFFRRFADLFRGSHADTVSVKRDSGIARVDTVTKHVDISRKIAKILDDADREEKDIANERHKDVRREMDDLKSLNTYLTQEQTKKMESLRLNERKLIQQDMARALKARQRLIVQIVILSILAIVIAIILLWRIWHDSKREQEYRETLEQANAETQRVMKQREQLLLTITHDIKAPAASITGFTDLLKEYIYSPKGLSLLGNVHDSAVHLSQLVASLLDYHQLENGLIKVNKTTFSPAKLATQCIMGMKPRADEKKLALSLETKDCKGIYCEGDAFRIRQIIDNLLSNAVKYTDKGSVLLTLSVRNGNLSIEVKDTGKGIAKEEQEEIFQAFKRLGNAQGTEGAGLGLSIVSRLVSLLGGEITLNSILHKGSTFSVSLPVKVVKTTDTETKQTDDKRQKSFRNHHLLILDDDPLQLKLLQEMIRQTAGGNWTVTACGHITEALTAIHNVQPSLMLMDIEMPEMNGTDFISHIDHHDITVIAMTAHDESIVPSLREAGFDGCLFKPIKNDELAKILNVGTHVRADETFSGNTNDNIDIDPEIREALDRELDEFKVRLSKAVSGEKPDRKAIADIAHKLLPLAKMFNFYCIDIVERLIPEKIDLLSDEEVVNSVKSLFR